MELKKFFTRLIILSSILTVSYINTNAQYFVNIGTIHGEAPYDFSGCAVSMPDANTIAVGAYQNDGSGSDAGHVRIYSWDSSIWGYSQKGNDIDGEASLDNSGYSVSMPDPNTVAVGAPGNDGNGNSSGHVRIYKWDGTGWIQKGTDINGITPNDESGFSVSMPDSNTVAIGSPTHSSGAASSIGHVRVFTWNGNTWNQKGPNITGEAMGDRSGYSVCMPNPNTVAVGATRNSGNGSASGHVRVFTWSNNTWVQKGLDIDGEATGDFSGHSVSMPDNNTLAIGAPLNNGNGFKVGHVRIFHWDGSTWGQKGNDIDGKFASEEFGYSVSMPDANTITIGAPYLSLSGPPNFGATRVYGWDGSTWVQYGTDIYGSNSRDYSGYSVSMPDPNTIAIGSIQNQSFSNRPGQARVFSNTSVDIAEYNLTSAIQLYPNPTGGTGTIEFNKVFSYCIVTISDVLGQIINRITMVDSDKFSFELESGPGLYFIEVIADGNSATLKLIKE